ncbi:MAG: hydroxyacylglutathione hydrolase, partial [Burkholderiaceae bacterium]
MTPIPAFNDNYLWLLARGRIAAVVDPGDAAPIVRALEERQVDLAVILVTHHHGDHVGGVLELKERYGARVYGPAGEQIAGLDRRLVAGDRVRELDLEFQVIEVPGHTRGHIAYFAADAEPPLLFCGDTLFGCGCGRLFEGTPAQMLASLDQLRGLPDATQVYCAHEYTLSNIRFAQAVEPHNADLQERARAAKVLREAGQPTLPSTIGLERATNPFLRSDAEAVRASAQAHVGRTGASLD